jgi:threonine/homoserine/homoserine lactone efflux protein
MTHLIQFLYLGMIILLGAMIPGPDCILVTKNTLAGSRRLGVITGFGIALALVVHITYISIGLAYVDHESKTAFLIVKIIGSFYLSYLGIKLIREGKTTEPVDTEEEKKQLTPLKAFMSGFLCNILNPKASLFIFGLLTQMVKPTTLILTLVLIAVEIVLITIGWFALLSCILTHKKISDFFNRHQSYLNVVLGTLIIGFAASWWFFN